MSRCIDVDELLNRLPDDLPYKASVKRVLMQAPTADVAPKSEVAKEIFDELDKFIVTRFVYYGAPEYDVSDKYIEVKKKYGAYDPVPIKTLTNSRKRIICSMRKRKLKKNDGTEGHDGR